MANKSKTQAGVSTEQAAAIHELLGQCFETSLRQQLMSGEFNAAMIGKTVDWLKHNNISVVEDADEHLKGLANVFRHKEGNDLMSYLDGINAREV